jgi:hypothetical protein
MDGNYDAERRALCAAARAAACADEAMVADVMRLLRTVMEATGERFIHIPVDMSQWETSGGCGPVHYYSICFADGVSGPPLVAEVVDPGRLMLDDEGDFIRVGFVNGDCDEVPLNEVYQDAMQRLLKGYRKYGAWQLIERWVDGRMRDCWERLCSPPVT